MRPPGDTGESPLIPWHSTATDNGADRAHPAAPFCSDHAEPRALDELTAAIEARRDAGEDVDLEEHASGTELQVGYRRLQANARLLRSAINRGLAVPDLAETIELPQGVSRLVIRDLDE